MKKVAVLQSNYIPWKGYFDIIHDVDHFVFYDDVQYTKNDWRNRNLIKTSQGTTWLTIPVGSALDRKICDVQIEDHRWAVKHWKSLKQNYSKAPFMEELKPFLEEVYLGKEWTSLSELNRYMIEVISRDFLNIDVHFYDSRDFDLSGRKQDRLLDLLQKLKADTYVSGPSASSYIDEEAYRRAGIELVYKDYSGYPEYSQFYPPFEHGVTILDLLFHVGSEAPWYIWGWRRANQEGE